MALQCKEVTKIWLNGWTNKGALGSHFQSKMTGSSFFLAIEAWFDFESMRSSRCINAWGTQDACGDGYMLLVIYYIISSVGAGHIIIWRAMIIGSSNLHIPKKGWYVGLSHASSFTAHCLALNHWCHYPDSHTKPLQVMPSNWEHANILFFHLARTNSCDPGNTPRVPNKNYGINRVCQPMVKYVIVSTPHIH